jgi:hypothetical protein
VDKSQLKNSGLDGVESDALITGDADGRGDEPADEKTDGAERDKPALDGAYCDVRATAGQNTACDEAKHDDGSDKLRRNIRKTRHYSSNTNRHQPNMGRHNMDFQQQEFRSRRKKSLCNRTPNTLKEWLKERVPFFLLHPPDFFLLIFSHTNKKWARIAQIFTLKDSLVFILNP